ncbi:hypothetical protein [Acrocarpospora catenulata]|uniref:hypothetical protein n=1 Tax=Acrocarpospora catenulata TaxID=2836182 RepID=UPI001BD9CA40|nr:hypothetical protein [Acrocarpospora catenulata]
MTDQLSGSPLRVRVTGHFAVELLVPARERPHIARALFAAAERLGLHAEVVRSTSNGYLVP